MPIDAYMSELAPKLFLLFFRQRAEFKKTFQNQNAVYVNLRNSRRNLCSEEQNLAHNCGDQTFCKWSLNNRFQVKL